MGGEGTRRRKNRNERYLSFSARLPNDAQWVSAQSICMVKLSSDPYDDFKESIMEMVQAVGIRSWEEMEELVYCYVVLNSPDVHGVIMDAFLSVKSKERLGGVRPSPFPKTKGIGGRVVCPVREATGADAMKRGKRFQWYLGFSNTLPGDVQGVFANGIVMVKRAAFLFICRFQISQQLQRFNRSV